MEHIIFVTSNENKVREAQEILGFPITAQKIDLDEIQLMDLDEIIEHKLQQAWDQLGQPVLVEDSGIFFDDWNGFPGPMAKLLSETMTYDKAASLLGPTRTIHWRVKVGYKDTTKLLVGSGEITGTMATERRGDSWGFDPFFIPEGMDQTYAEMGDTKKHSVSARAKAFRDLEKQLEAL